MSPVVIVHYHLLRGGVTRVIELTSDQLTAAGIPHIIISGSPYEGKFKLPVEIVPELSYREEAGELTPKQLKEKLKKIAFNALGKAPLIWHIHNHSIGKNTLFSDTITLLAQEGERMVLQIHDFAEDGRASNYKHLDHKPHIYPIAPQIKYAFINSRDRYLMHNAGLPDTNSTVLPNCVKTCSKAHLSPKTHKKPLVLYPTRGIRRKNLGELFLLSALCPEEANYAVTLPPENKKWLPIYEDWQEFQKDTQLPVALEVTGNTPPTEGGDSSFEEWVSHATHIITTSVAEGFGLNFIEPTAAGKPLIGRNLPDITCDFKAHELKFPHLYERILIPLEWIGLEQLRQTLCSELRKMLEAYGKDMSSSHLETAFQSLLHDEMIDFGNLPEDWQRKLIKKIINENLSGEVFVEQSGEKRRANNWLSRVLTVTTANQSPSILETYSPEKNRERLIQLYNCIDSPEATSPEWLNPHNVLSQFLKPERFHFLRA